MVEIDREVAQKDLDKARSTFKTLGQGSEMDRAAQMVIQSLRVLRNRVDKPSVLKLLYLDNPGAAELLPEAALEVVRRLNKGEISSEEAKDIIDEALPRYVDAFEGLGVKPQSISHLSSKGR